MLPMEDKVSLEDRLGPLGSKFFRYTTLGAALVAAIYNGLAWALNGAPASPDSPGFWIMFTILLVGLATSVVLGRVIAYVLVIAFAWTLTFSLITVFTGGSSAYAALASVAGAALGFAVKTVLNPIEWVVVL
jgi:hypothetical protein